MLGFGLGLSLLFSYLANTDTSDIIIIRLQGTVEMTELQILQMFLHYQQATRSEEVKCRVLVCLSNLSVMCLVLIRRTERGSAKLVISPKCPTLQLK